MGKLPCQDISDLEGKFSVLDIEIQVHKCREILPCWREILLSLQGK